MSEKLQEHKNAGAQNCKIANRIVHNFWSANIGERIIARDGSAKGTIKGRIEKN